MTEDEMIGWPHEFEHEFEQALRVGDEQGSQACCSPWGHSQTGLSHWKHKEKHTIEQDEWFCCVIISSRIKES